MCTGLASLGGARELLGGLKGMSGLGGSIRMGHQHSCCSPARFAGVAAVSAAAPSAPAEQQQQRMKGMCAGMSCVHALRYHAPHTVCNRKGKYERAYSATGDLACSEG